jgi:NitT/TauT family transport system substrate-binding protein
MYRHHRTYVGAQLGEGNGYVNQKFLIELRSVVRLLVVLSTSLLLSCAPAAAPRTTPTASTAPTAPATSAGYAPTPLNPPVKVSVGLLASTTDSGIFVGQAHGYFQQEGIELDLQHFQTLVDMVAPVSNGQLDVAAGALAAGLYNAAARNIGVRIVADKGQDPSHDWDFSALVIRKALVDSGQVKDYADLKGLKLVTSGRGNSPEVSLATALKKGGLTLQDVNYSQMGFPDMVTSLATGAIDGGIMIEPFISRVLSDGTGVRWKGNVDIMGGDQQVAVIVYSAQFAGKQDVAQRWMNAYIRGVRDYNDAFGPNRKGYADVVNILAQNTTVTDAKVYDQMVPAGLNPDGKLDVQSMESDLAYYRESGQVKDPVDLSTLVDTSFQTAAVKALGAYSPKP